MTAVNSAYFESLKSQINCAGSCEELQQLATDALQLVSDQIAGISQQLEPLNKLQDLLEIPANPGEAVTWIGNYITIVLTPMYKPYQTYVQQLAALPAVISDLQQTINTKMSEFDSCSINLPTVQFPELPSTQPP